MHVSVSEQPGPTIRINCPKCGGVGVPAETLDQVEAVAVVVRHATSWVRCGACGSWLLSKLPAAELAGRSPEDLTQFVVRRHPPAHVYLTVSALLFCWMPIVGQLLALLGLWINRRRRLWWWLSLTALALGLLVITATVLVVARGPATRPPKPRMSPPAPERP